MDIIIYYCSQINYQLASAKAVLLLSCYVTINSGLDIFIQTLDKTINTLFNENKKKEKKTVYNRINYQSMLFSFSIWLNM